MGKKHRVAQRGTGSRNGLIVSATRSPVGRMRLRVEACGRAALTTVALMMVAIIVAHGRPLDYFSERPDPPRAVFAVAGNIDDDDDNIDDDSIDDDGIDVDDPALTQVAAEQQPADPSSPCPLSNDIQT